MREHYLFTSKVLVSTEAGTEILAEFGPLAQSGREAYGGSYTVFLTASLSCSVGLSPRELF